MQAKNADFHGNFAFLLISKAISYGLDAEIMKIYGKSAYLGFLKMQQICSRPYKRAVKQIFVNLLR